MILSTLRWLMAWFCWRIFCAMTFGGGIRVQEPTANDQTDHLMSATVIGFRSSLLQQQTLSAFLIKGGQDLVIALTGEVVFSSSLGRPQTLALAFDEHGEAAADLIIIGNAEGASGHCEAEHFL